MQRLTSDNTPIRIDFLPSAAVRLPGRIGMTIAPGKKISGFHGMWDRDLDKDLVRIKTVLGASVLVCLLEPDELELLHISALPETARRLGLEVLQLAIPDVGVPDNIERLRDLVAGILAAAAAGKSVVIHCRGGLGRSGLVAACCLAALGMPAGDAISAVRVARKGAIETLAQEQSVRDFWANVQGGTRWAFADVRARRINPRGKPAFSSFVGCLVGGAVGDALGYPVEFIGSARAIVDQFGHAPPPALDFAKRGEALVSDDTQMTLFVAEGAIRAIQRHRDRGLASVSSVITRALLRWHDTQTTSHAKAIVLEDKAWRSGWLRTDARLYARRAPGNTCMSSLQKLAAAEGGSLQLNHSKGCGAIMRSAPLGLAASDRARAFQVACESGAATHGHPLGYLPAGYLASVIFDVARGLQLSDAMTLADDLLRHEAAAGQSPAPAAERAGLEAVHRQGALELLGWTQRARDAASSVRGSISAADVEALGAGWTGEEALAIGLFCGLKVKEGDPDTVAGALWAAVVHGGDSDSTGAITGNILGAALGIDALPGAWVERVELRDTIERLAGDLFAAAVENVEIDDVAYPPN